MQLSLLRTSSRTMSRERLKLRERDRKYRDDIKKIRTVFVVNNSVSMSGSVSFTGVNISKLDMAKSFIELFCDHTTKKPEFNFGQSLLVTYDEKSPIKAHFDDSAQTLKNACKIMQPRSTQNVEGAFKSALEYLNLLCWVEDSDSPGYGRYLFKTRQFVIFWLTDGEHFTTDSRDGDASIISKMQTQLLKDFGLPLYDKPYRWDWRFFPVLIGEKVQPSVKAECERLAKETCGKVIHLTSSLDVRASTEVLAYHEKRTKANRALFSYLEGSLSFSCVVRLEPYRHGGKFAARDPVKLYLRSHQYLHGAAPLPEPLWPEDFVESSFLRQHPQPMLQFDAKNLVAENYVLPSNTRFEEAELDANSWFAQYAGTFCSERRKQVSFAVYMANRVDGRSALGPFGIIEHAASSPSSPERTTLKILPYNWPELFNLINELGTTSLRDRPPRPWVERLAQYVKSIPQYYMNSLQKQFEAWQLLHVFRSAEMYNIKGVGWRYNFNEKISEIQKQVVSELLAQQEAISEHTRSDIASAEAHDNESESESEDDQSWRATFGVGISEEKKAVSVMRKQLARAIGFRGTHFEDSSHCLPMQLATHIRFPVRMRAAGELPEVEQWKDDCYGKNKYFIHDLWRRFIKPERPPKLPPLFENEGESDMEDVNWQFQTRLKDEFETLKQQVRSEYLYEQGTQLSPVRPKVYEYGGKIRPYVQHFPGKSVQLKKTVPRLNDDILVAPTFLFPRSCKDSINADDRKVEYDGIVDAILNGTAARFLTEQSAIRRDVCLQRRADPYKSQKESQVDALFSDENSANSEGSVNAPPSELSTEVSEHGPSSPARGQSNSAPREEQSPFISIASPQAKNRVERYEMETQRGYDASLLSRHNQHVIILDNEEVEEYHTSHPGELSEEGYAAAYFKNDPSSGNDNLPLDSGPRYQRVREPSLASNLCGTENTLYEGSPELTSSRSVASNLVSTPLLGTNAVELNSGGTAAADGSPLLSDHVANLESDSKANFDSALVKSPKASTPTPAKRKRGGTLVSLEDASKDSKLEPKRTTSPKDAADDLQTDGNSSAILYLPTQQPTLDDSRDLIFSVAKDEKDFTVEGFSSAVWKRQVNEVIRFYVSRGTAHSEKDMKAKVVEVTSMSDISADQKLSLIAYIYNQAKKRNCVQALNVLRQLVDV